MIVTGVQTCALPIWAQDLWEDVRQSNPVSVDGMADRIGPLLFGLLGLCAVAILLLMVLPPRVLGGRLPKQPGGWTFLLYFVCLGFGYVLIQMVLIRKVTPFLGPPTQALTVIVLSLLMMTAAGSYCSSRIATDGKSRLNYVLGTIAVLIGVLAIVAAPLIRQAATWPWLGRVALTVALIAPVAFFMGMPLAVGLRRLVRLQPAFVRWAWSLKVAASVMGWVASLVLSIYLGLRATMLIGGVMYLLALAALAATQRNTEA